MSRGRILAAARARKLARRFVDKLLVRSAPEAFATLGPADYVRAWRNWAQLNVLLAWTYRAAVRSRGSYDELRKSLAAFNTVYRQFARAAPWEPLIELHAHHAVEERFLKAVLADPALKKRFAADLQRLGWKTPGDMHAVPFEKRFHINKGQTLAEEVERATGKPMDGAHALAEIKSLTDSLEAAIPHFRDFQNMHEVLDAYEKFYKRPITLKSGRTITPLWDRVADSFAEMRRLLGPRPATP